MFLQAIKSTFINFVVKERSVYDGMVTKELKRLTKGIKKFKTILF